VPDPTRAPPRYQQRHNTGPTLPGILVEVEGDEIVVTLPDTDFRVAYKKAPLESRFRVIAPTEQLDKILAGQIRERFAAGSADQCAAWIQNESVASAVLCVPAFVSGMQDAEAEAYLRMRAERLHPDETEALNAVRKGLNDLRDIGAVTEKYFPRAMATPNVETAARTQRAQAAFAQTVATAD
jgi:hypothetical protein